MSPAIRSHKGDLGTYLAIGDFYRTEYEAVLRGEHQDHGRWLDLAVNAARDAGVTLETIHEWQAVAEDLARADATPEELEEVVCDDRR